MSNGDIQLEGEVIRPPSFPEWASTTNNYEYRTYFTNANKDKRNRPTQAR